MRGCVQACVHSWMRACTRAVSEVLGDAFDDSTGDINHESCTPERADRVARTPCPTHSLRCYGSFPEPRTPRPRLVAAWELLLTGILPAEQDMFSLSTG